MMRLVIWKMIREIILQVLILPFLCPVIVKNFGHSQALRFRHPEEQAPIHPAGEPMVNVGKDKYIFSDGKRIIGDCLLKEIARIQTFPDWYEFSRGTSNRNDNAKLDLVYKQIGNAVPVRLALAVAEPIAGS